MSSPTLRLPAPRLVLLLALLAPAASEATGSIGTSCSPAQPGAAAGAGRLAPGQVAAGQGAPAAQAAERPLGRLLVSGYTSGTLHVYAAGTGTHLGDFGTAAVPGAQKIRRGPGGLLYACSETTNRVLRFDDAGTFHGALVADDPLTPADETGGLDGPTGAVFAADGSLLVASFGSDAVLRYDGATGAFLGVFVAPGSGGLDGPDAGITFGSDGDLYVPSFESNAILVYSRADGSFLRAFASGGELSRPRDLVFRGGKLYVSSWGSNRILRYDATTGAYLGVFANSNRPTGIAFDPWHGDLWVTSDNGSNVRRHDGLTGAFQRVVVPAGSGGLAGGTYLFWLVDGR